MSGSANRVKRRKRSKGLDRLSGLDSGVMSVLADFLNVQDLFHVRLCIRGESLRNAALIRIGEYSRIRAFLLHWKCIDCSSRLSKEFSLLEFLKVTEVHFCPLRFSSETRPVDFLQQAKHLAEHTSPTGFGYTQVTRFSYSDLNTTIPEVFRSLFSRVELFDFSCWYELADIPEDFPEHFPALESLNLAGCYNIKSLPDSVLTHLERKSAEADCYYYIMAPAALSTYLLERINPEEFPTLYSRMKAKPGFESLMI